MWVEGEATYMTRAFDEAEAELNYHIIVTTKNFRNSASDPSAPIVSDSPERVVNSVRTSS